MLMMTAVIEQTQTFAYVGLVAVFGALAGLLYGALGGRRGPGLDRHRLAASLDSAARHCSVWNTGAQTTPTQA